jgi:segregation and condensation protein A
MAEYKVKFEVFEGPLDLLLYLIKKEEVDIYAVNLTQLATQFIEYIELMRQFDLEIAGEFLVMASTLMYIKSRELLPVDQDAAAQLQVLEERQEGVYPRLPGKLEFENALPAARPDVSLFDLLNAVNGILKRFGTRADRRDIFEDKWTVSEKIEFILRVIAEGGRRLFSELFEGVTSRSEIVVTFLALLELIRLKQIACTQSAEFGEIEISRAAGIAPVRSASPASSSVAVSPVVVTMESENRKL